MRPIRLTVAAALLAALPALAQTGTPPGTAQPPPPPQPAPVDAKLLAHLQAWEKAMTQVTSLGAELKRTDKDKTFKTEQHFVGHAKYSRDGTPPNVKNRAVLEMRAEGSKPTDDPSEKFVCTGAFLYQYSPATKQIRAYALPTPKPGQSSHDSFLGFLFGTGAQETLRRYDLKAREDQHYVYVDVVPKEAADKADFTRARIVLHRENYLPRQLWFESPAGSETTWDIPKVQPNAQFPATDFDAPKAPTGWQIIKVERNDAPPKIVRPGQP